MRFFVVFCAIICVDDGFCVRDVKTARVAPQRVPRDRDTLKLLDARKFCRHHANKSDVCHAGNLLDRVEEGIALAVNECQWQFRNRRWNCTTARRSLRKILQYDTRESAFVEAILAAGITYAVTKACTRGEFDCSCQKTARQTSKRYPTHATETALKLGVQMDGTWEWGGCGDNIHYGLRKSIEFLTPKNRRKSSKDLKALVRGHNEEAGRMILKKNMHVECKCHGLSGSCTLKTCWRRMPVFRVVGNILKDHFDGAAKVLLHNNGRKLVPESGIKPPTAMDLVYAEDSPSFCRPNRQMGSLGTSQRVCNNRSPGVDGCELLCCGRGFRTREFVETVKCRCRFRWCCHVDCDVCRVRRRVHVCL